MAVAVALSTSSDVHGGTVRLVRKTGFWGSVVPNSCRQNLTTNGREIGFTTFDICV